MEYEGDRVQRVGNRRGNSSLVRNRGQNNGERGEGGGERVTCDETFLDGWRIL